jgi:hypothetical protein|tara:strand:- start:316 stop:630 length:315 start_codon:yes stop_codon:yes gene_type:complete
VLSLGKRNQYNKRKFPIPVKLISNHHPDLLISCSLRTLTAIPGIHVKKKTNREIDPVSLLEKKIISRRKANKAKNNSNNLQYQYSERLALPEKIVYLLKQVFIA